MILLTSLLVTVMESIVCFTVMPALPTGELALQLFRLSSFEIVVRRGGDESLDVKVYPDGLEWASHRPSAFREVRRFLVSYL